MKKFLYWPYQIYAWLIFFPLVVVLTLFFSLMTVIFATQLMPSSYYPIRKELRALVYQALIN